MDYGGQNDTDALAGSSPWGSSSPRAGRTPYTPQTPSAPDSPEQTPGHQHTSSQDSISANPFASEASATAQALPPPAQEDSTLDVSQSGPPQATGPLQPQQPVQQPGHQGHPQMRPGAARYHSQRQQRPVPAYKLQAKVTALERTGRKDPVIRFDVYVRDITLVCDQQLTFSRPTFPNSARRSSETSAARTLNSSSSLITSSRRIQRHSCLQFLLR